MGCAEAKFRLPAFSTGADAQWAPAGLTGCKAHIRPHRLLDSFKSAHAAVLLMDARQAAVDGHTISPEMPRYSSTSHPRAQPTCAQPLPAKFGLLDTPMRLTMQKTGALAVWRCPFRLLEKTAGPRWTTR